MHWARFCRLTGFSHQLLPLSATPLSFISRGTKKDKSQTFKIKNKITKQEMWTCASARWGIKNREVLQFRYKALIQCVKRKKDGFLVFSWRKWKFLGSSFLCEGLGLTQGQICHWSNMLPSNVFPHCELCVCLQPRPPAACYIRPDTCYGNNMQMDPSSSSPTSPPNLARLSTMGSHASTPTASLYPCSSAAHTALISEPKMETCESISTK